MGTPSAVYNAAGVKDVVRKGRRGLMVEENRTDLLAVSIIKVFKNDKLYKELVLRMESFEEEVGWENTAKVAFSVIAKHGNRKN